MIATFCLFLACIATVVTQDAKPESQGIRASVDPRVELMSIIFRLAGNTEYNQPSSMSPYANEVEAHFGRFRDHPAVKKARRLHSLRGVSYDAVMSMALHITDTEKLEEKIPFDQHPPRLDERWRVRDARSFLKQARDFVEKTGFNEFFEKHEKLYEDTGRRMTETLNRRGYLDWFDKFFGQRRQAKFAVYVGMLNGGCCYGCGVRHADGREEITPVLGVWKFDDDGVPVFDDGITPTVVHEFCHSYTNAFVDKYADDLEPAGKRIFSHCAETMKQQAYGNWKTMLYESMVRACVVCYLHDTDGRAAARKEIRSQHGRGFRWVGKLAKLLGEYESNRDKYKTFDEFMPRVVAFFNDYADKYDQETKSAPKVLSMTPANGADDVDPGLKEITIVFDRPMRDKCWAVVGGGPHFPEITGDLHYDQARKVLTIPVKLKPAWSYQFWLNRGRFNSFMSEDGTQLESVAVTFETRAK